MSEFEAEVRKAEKELEQSLVPLVNDNEYQRVTDDEFLGDIKMQAQEYGHGLERELLYLAVHGVLHLLGYDHMAAEDKVVMRKREEEVLRELDMSEEFFGG